MFIKFHRGISSPTVNSSVYRTAIIVDAEGAETIADLKHLIANYAKYDLDLSSVTVIISERVADIATLEEVAKFGIELQERSQTFPLFKFAVFNPRSLVIVQDRARTLKSLLETARDKSFDRFRKNNEIGRVEIPAVSYVSPRDYASLVLAYDFDRILSVGRNTDIYALSNIIDNYDFVAADKWA